MLINTVASIALFILLYFCSYDETVDVEEQDTEELDSEPEVNVEGSDNASDMSTDSISDEDVWHRVMDQITGETCRPDLIKPDVNKYDSKKLLKVLRMHVEDLIKFAHKVENTDIYDAISKEKSRLEEIGYEEDEAVLTAWKNRQYLLKTKVLKPFIEQIDINEEENDSDEEGTYNS